MIADPEATGNQEATDRHFVILVIDQAAEPSGLARTTV
jgi:hypothetical protein